MVFLLGVMGAMAFGASAFLGMTSTDEGGDTADSDSSDDAAQTDAGLEAGESGTSVTDFYLGTAPAEVDDAAANDASCVTDEPPAADLPDEGLPDDYDHSLPDAPVGAEIWGGLDDDTIVGGAGNDTLHGGAGDDLIYSEEGDNRMFGHGDDDTLIGGAGDDSLVGGAGDDMLEGGAGEDTLHGGLGDDQLRGGLGHDVIFGGWGDDTISGLELDPDADGWVDMDTMDYLNGGPGDDVIIAGAEDIVTTGEGADTVLLGPWIDAGQEAQILDFSPDEDRLMVVYDDETGDAPKVDLIVDPENANLQHVMLNGVLIAAVNNSPGLNVGHITVIGHSQLPAGVAL